MRRRIISILLVLTIGLSSIIPAYGTDVSSTNNIDSDDINTIIDSLADISINKEAYDFGDVDFSLLSVGANIPVYKCDNEVLSPVEFKMYPIFSQSELVAFAVVSDSGTEYASAQIFRNIADDLNSLDITWDDALYFVYDSNGFNIVHNSEIDTLSPLVNNSFDDAYVPVITDSIALSVTLGENETQIASASMLSVQPRASNYIYTSVTTTTQVPTLYNHLCWAASVACIGRALTGTIYAASTVAKLYKGDNFDQPAYCSESREALDDIYGVSYTHYAAVPSDDRINNNISNGYPMYGQFEGSGTTHATVIYGIDILQALISIMDPYTASKFNIYVKYNSSAGVWTYGYTNPYADDETIYLAEHICKVA